MWDISGAPASSKCTQSLDFVCLTDFSENFQKFLEISEDTWIFLEYPRILSNFLETSRSRPELDDRTRDVRRDWARDVVDLLILILWAIRSFLVDIVVVRSRRYARTDGRSTTVRGSGDTATLDRRKLTTRRSAPAPRRRAPRRQVACVPATATSRARIFRSDAARCCACSRAEGETTRKKLRRMHATVVRASLNSRTLVCVLRRDNFNLAVKFALLHYSLAKGISRCAMFKSDFFFFFLRMEDLILIKYHGIFLDHMIWETLCYEINTLCYIINET